MSEELVVVPLVGTALDLTAPDEDLVKAVDEIRDFERQLSEVRARVGDELIRRMDSRAVWTINAGSFKASAPSPEDKVVYDADALRDVLAELVSEGLVGQEAAANALKAEVTHKPVVRGINALRKVSVEVAARLDACATEVPKTRRVRVEVSR